MLDLALFVPWRLHELKKLPSRCFGGILEVDVATFFFSRGVEEGGAGEELGAVLVPPLSREDRQGGRRQVERQVKDHFGA
jgi:hypothetical protein